MKTTKYLLLATIIFGFQLQMHADNTDISTLDNVVYIESFSAAAGSSYTISVKMKNTVDAVGFYFDLILPDGIFVPKKEGSNKPMAYLSTERTNSDNTGFIADYKLDGTLQVQAYDNGGLISGNDGEIATIVINIASDMPEGDYPIQLKNTGVVQTNSLPLRTDLVETSITVTALADTRTFFDENSDNADVLKAATGVDVRVKRTIKAGQWSTICLPFAMTAEQVESAFGSGVELADFNGIETTYEDESESIVSSIKVKFNTVTAIEANHPYIIRVGTPVSEFTVDNVDIIVEEIPSVDKDEFPYQVMVGKNKYETRYLYNSFVGTYVAETQIPEKCLFLSENQFWYSTGLTKSKGFRAYFDFYEWLPEAELSSARVQMLFEESEATGISGVAHETSDNRYYNLNGQQVENPKKGLYIKKNKKVVVK